MTRYIYAAAEGVILDSNADLFMADLPPERVSTAPYSICPRSAWERRQDGGMELHIDVAGTFRIAHASPERLPGASEWKT